MKHPLENIHFKLSKVILSVVPPGTELGPSIMDRYQFLWVLEGHCQWKCDGAIHEVPSDSIYLSRPGMQCFFRWDPRRMSRAIFIQFWFKEKIRGIPPEKEWPKVRAMPPGDVIRPLMRHLAVVMDEGGPHAESLAQWAIRQIFLSYIMGVFRGRKWDRNTIPAPVEKVLTHVQKKWQAGRMESSSQTELARVAGISVRHLSRLFQQTFQCGPLEAMRLTRIGRAAVLLKTSNLQIQEIAELTGFENPFYFSRCFKEVYRLSPREYRKSSDIMVPTTQLIRSSPLREYLLEGK